eukprot:CAMPEP_0195524936 /NCGR_PEP_ID=MMETSP0794_2-20130614/25069_1 /TAXON_ID=515487 /ORGANISM="Stephanopyxis turris, Strain CCMP 815" /LENGTH=430 /DNA_ID=CAMNT_0040655271 /DNA_START=295 /DNA_END=1587 /DNA_ORIENTATION=-
MSRTLPSLGVSPNIPLKNKYDAGGQKRYLNLHEYQSLSLMKKAGMTTQNGAVARTPEEARTVAETLVNNSPGCDLIVKAQIHAGGRGKGSFSNGFQGGVQILTDPADVERVSPNMLGVNLVTKQTGPEGQPCNSLLINEGITIVEEYYLAILLDREAGGPVIVASQQGGMDIEEVAESDPDAITVVTMDINTGLTDEQAEKVASKGLGLEDGDLKNQAVRQIKALGQMFLDLDATQIEVNPFAVADDGCLYCVDAKLNFDDNAHYRQGEVFQMRDVSMEDPRDVRAEKSNLNYIGLDGSIGCMVNGAGLAMATMDIIKLSGGSPANFLDVGGGASKEQVAEAFKILTSDPNVKGLLINIFGGIMKCDVIAQGIISAHKEVGLDVPLVVRLEGTNVKEGKAMLENSGLPIITASDLDDAAQKAVSAVNNLG